MALLQVQENADVTWLYILVHQPRFLENLKYLGHFEDELRQKVCTIRQRRVESTMLYGPRQPISAKS